MFAMQEKRTPITDETTCRKILGMSLDEYAEVILRFEADAYEVIVRQRGLEAHRENLDFAAGAVAYARSVGLDAWLAAQGERDTEPLDGYSTAWDSLMEGYVQCGELASYPYVEACQRVYSEQWAEEFSDFWRKVHNAKLIAGEANRLHPDDLDAVAIYIRLVEDEVWRVLEAIRGAWYDATAKKVARARERAQDAHGNRRRVLATPVKYMGEAELVIERNRPNFSPNASRETRWRALVALAGELHRDARYTQEAAAGKAAELYDAWYGEDAFASQFRTSSLRKEISIHYGRSRRPPRARDMV